ncbi:MAG TPA: ASCH domain-containing protein [Planctomycetes bacterium]|nr:ASCH domain-containing protein [Planctomycetota bacterium]
MASERRPRAWALSVVADGAGQARRISRTTRVDIVPFGLVSAGLARVEGKGDGSLAHWQRVHRESFARTPAPLGIEPTDELEIVCERFEVVFRSG